MAIKGGSILHVGNGLTVIDRVQTGGPGQLNIPTEKIYELGNYKSVATVRDTPDLSFSLESLDTSTEIETLLASAYAGRNVTDGITEVGTTLTSATAAFTSADVGRMVIIPGAGAGGADLVTTIDTVTNGTTVELVDGASAVVNPANVRITANGIDLAQSVPIDFAGQFKGGLTATDPFKVVGSVAFPFLYLEQMSYRFGLTDNATQSASLRGDSIFYNPGASFVETANGTNTPGQTIVTAHPAYQLGSGDQRRVLAVTVGDTRLTFGADYTESYGSVTGGAAVTTVTLVAAVPTDKKVRVIYASPDQVTYPQNVHPDTVLKPAAVKGRDIEIYIGGYDPNDVAGSQANKMFSVQSVQTDWRVTLDKDQEFGNHFAVGQDFDVPAVTGSVDVKPRDAAHMLDMVRKFAGVTDVHKVVGPDTAVPLELDIVIKHPDTAKVVKRIHVPDARFTAPGYSGRVQTKLTQTFSYESDSGQMLVFER